MDGGLTDYTGPRTSTERALAAIWAHMFRLPRVGVTDSFAALGGDSMLALEIAAVARPSGLEVTVGAVLEEDTIERLARYVDTRASARRAVVHGTEAIPLMPGQCWFFYELSLPDPNIWSRAALLAVPGDADPDVIRRALLLVIERNDALRLRFTRRDGVWSQEVRPGPAQSSLHFAVARADGADPAMVIADATFHARQAMDITEGVLLSGTLIDLGPSGTRLLLVVHQLTADAFAMRLLLEDLRVAWRHVAFGSRGEPVHNISSFADCAAALPNALEQLDVSAEMEFWTRQRARSINPEHAGGAAGHPQGRVTCEFSPEELHRLRDGLWQRWSVGLDEAILTALAFAYLEWSRGDCPLLEMYSHGRLVSLWGQDTSRTSGRLWFTYPLTLPAVDRLDGTLGLVKEKLSAIPNHGVGYSLLRHYGDEEVRASLSALPVPQIAYNNYSTLFSRILGSHRRLMMFSRAPEEVPLLHIAEETERWPLRVTPQMTPEDGMVVEVYYAMNVFRHATVERLAALLRRALIDLAKSPMGRGRRPRHGAGGEPAAPRLRPRRR